MSQILPDYIILDEFHRCGAESWGEGVQRFLSINIHASVLGLSATAIRYLDNQRDMADELFEGNVASEITLGEALVRGILKPPKYILSTFSYQKDLERYQRKVRAIQSNATRDIAQNYLDELRRALNKADGLDEIFHKHIEKHDGKFIVFCANLNHMHEMINLAPKWFCKVDPSPRIYSAYSNDPSTSKAFANFKSDTSSHLKLLFCIDMLNEGIHIDSVDGVILLRPTVSPIIYKQQIGRALSASNSQNVVIFDIVMNIMNLYSISTIEQEMNEAINYFEHLGNSPNIIYSHFQVIDEVRDCRELFDKLNDTLTASWDVMYEVAKQYYNQFGNLNPHSHYKTNEGYALGNWLVTQRSIRKGRIYGTLTDELMYSVISRKMSSLSSVSSSWLAYFFSLRLG